MSVSFTQSSAEVRALAEENQRVPIYKVIAADLLTPVSAYLKLRRLSPHSFLLESAQGGESVGRYSFLGASPCAVLRARDGTIELERQGERETVRTGFIEAMREMARERRNRSVKGLPPFTSGAVGYIGYDAVRWFEEIPGRHGSSGDDLAAMMYFDEVLAFDHLRQQLWIVVNVRASELQSDFDGSVTKARSRIEELEELLESPLDAAPLSLDETSVEVSERSPKEEYCRAVERAREYILAGDIFQVVLSQQMTARFENDPFQLYRALRVINPSPYMFHLALGGMAICGASPEMLVKCSGSTIHYRPIAGTRPRGADEAADRALEAELRSDEKERAEHVMLVDLGRNDVGKVAAYGSVRVDEFMTVERYSHVMHLVSAISAKLRDGADCFDALAACFPAGTVSGAPKVRAMEIIDELEPCSRGVYSGTVLYTDDSGNLDSCIAIRTFFVKDGKAYVQAGAGIVADSVPEREYEECRNKARVLIRALEIAQGAQNL